MDKWVFMGIGAALAVVQLVLFESVRGRQKTVLEQLSEAQQIDRTPVTNRAVEQALATIWQRTCLRSISMMAPMLGVVLTAVGFLTLQDRMSFEVRKGLEASRSSFVGSLGPLYSGVLLGALSALLNQILVLILDVKAQALQSRLWRRMTDDLSELPAALTSPTTIHNSDELRLRVVQEMKDNLIEAMTRIATPVDQTANRLLDAGRGLSESQSRLQDAVTRFVNSTGEASVRLQETARSFQAGQEQLRGRLEEVLQTLQEVPDEFLKVTKVWTSSLQCLVEQSQLVNARVSEALSPPSSEPHAVVPSRESSGSGLREQYPGAGDSLEEFAAADGAISLREVRAPQPAHLAPGQTRGDLDEGPRTVPLKPELTTSANSNVPAFRLDPKRIHAIQSETEQVNEFLREAMRDPETERADAKRIIGSPQVARPRVPVSTMPVAEVSPQITMPESDRDAFDCFRDLPNDLREFIRAAAAHRAWTRLDLDQLSRQHRVILGSAIERINEWSLNRFNDALFVEDTESFLVQVDLLR